MQPYMIFSADNATPKVKSTLRIWVSQGTSACYHSYFYREKHFKNERANRTPSPGPDCVEKLEHLRKITFYKKKIVWDETKIGLFSLTKN